MMKKTRAQNEIDYGANLATVDAETQWGWGTPAGKLRAKRRTELILEGARVHGNVRVLEIGCGTGNFTEKFADSGAEIVAVDISPDLIEKAHQRGLSSRQVTFKVIPFEDLDIDEPFDAVIGSSILHHLEIEKALTQIFQLLKPGAYLSFAEPNMLNPQIFLERTFRFAYKNVTPDETAFVRSSLSRLLEKIGFTEIKITPFDWLHPATPECFMPCVSSVGRVLETIPILKEFSGSLAFCAKRPK